MRKETLIYPSFQKELRSFLLAMCLLMIGGCEVAEEVQDKLEKKSARTAKEVALPEGLLNCGTVKCDTEETLKERQKKAAVLISL